MGNESITYWNRLEPSARSNDLRESLAARIRDPLWLLTRQWQLGEFQGEDAGSPAYVQIASRVSELSRWRAPGGEWTEVPKERPLEWLAQSEPFGADSATRVELGQSCEAILAAEGLGEAVPALRAAYPVALPPEGELREMKDQAAARFLRICGERALDGAALWRAAGKTGRLPAEVRLSDALRPRVEAALGRFLEEVREVFGDLGDLGDLSIGDGPSWQPERLAYAAELLATGPSGQEVTLGGHPDRDGDFDWHAFDPRAEGERPEAPPQVMTRSAIPMHVRFRGMPNARFWDFESGTTDFGAMDIQRRDLARMVLMDFMLVHSNDWFIVPFSQPVGSLCWIEDLVVCDVFGGLTKIERADRDPVRQARERWTMFSTSVEGDPTGVGPFFFLPPTAATAVQDSAPIEEVRIFRDEMANLIWAVERTTENGVGEPWSGHERSMAKRAPSPEPPPPPAQVKEGQPALEYNIQSEVPEHWIPFLPVSLSLAKGEIALERAALLRDGKPVEPVGRILRPQGRTPYRIAEEEVPRTGVQISRVVRRSRCSDGTGRIWIARRKGPAAGEGGSGLRFDIAGPRR